jgi:hypothetical protein
MNHIEKIPNKLYGTSNTHRVTNRLIVRYNIEEERLTDEEYHFLLWDIDNKIIESDVSYFPKVTNPIPIIISEKDRATCLIWLKSREMAADPEEKERFRQMIDGVDF